MVAKIVKITLTLHQPYKNSKEDSESLRGNNRLRHKEEEDGYALY